MKAIFFYLLPILQFLLPFVFIGSAFPFSSVHIKMLHQNYTDMFHPDSLKDSIKVLQIQNFASFVRKQWSNLHLFLQKKKNEILSVFSVSIFHLFFALFCLTLLIYLTLSSSNINNLPLGTFFRCSHFFDACVPIFSISDSYPSYEVTTLHSITMFLGCSWLSESLLPKGLPYSPTNYL